MGVSPADLAQLSVEGKLDLISELWDSIETSDSTPALSESQSAELARRQAEGLRDPASMIDWSVIRKELRRESLARMPIRFHPAARAELLGARDWYGQAKAGLDTAFAHEVERVVNLIEDYPRRFPFHSAVVRRASLHHRRDPAVLERRGRGQ